MKFRTPRRRLRWSSLAGTLLLIVATLMTISAPANANWWGITHYYDTCGAWGNITDDKNVSFHYADASAELRAATNVVRTELLDPTDLNTSYDQVQNVNTDVVMVDRYYTDWCEDSMQAQWTTDGVFGIRGLTACYSTISIGRCNQAVVRISNTHLDVHNGAGDRFLVCHEVGHAVGLRHRSAVNGCMRQNVDISDRVYTPHDSGHINSTWANEPASGTE